MPLSTDFRWSVSAGYQIVEAFEGGVVEVDVEVVETAPSRPFLVEKAEGNVPPKVYFPLQQETGLFRVFADLDGTPASFLSFAERYGTLGGLQTAIHVGQKTFQGERLSDWASEIRDLRAFIDLWRMVSEKDTSRLSKFIVWVTPSTVVLRGRLDNVRDLVWCSRLSVAGLGAVREHPFLLSGQEDAVKVVLASADLTPDVFVTFRRGDVVQPAKFLLAVLLNQVIRERGISVGFSTRQFEFQLAPRDLRGALWLQFAMAVDGNKMYRPCLDCGKWFEIEGHAARADKVYCTASHKASANRKKKQKVKNLAAEGVAPDQITRLTDTDLRTVKRWIKA